MSHVTTRQPAIFVPHGGGPWPFMDDPGGRYRSLTTFLRHLPDSLPQRPDAVVVVTAHWEAEQFSVASGTHPELIYDYGGFPPHTYQVTYPAPGSPGTARRVADLATVAGMPAFLDERHGWDHGVFVPLAVALPEGDVPVVAVSLKRGLDPRDHIAFGAAISPVRDENVVIVGSGMSIHDLSFRITPTQAGEFTDWLQNTMNLPPAQRTEHLASWRDAPNALAAHPREEHLLPLMVIAGAGGDDPVVRSFDDNLFGLPAAAYTFGGRVS